jgi:hypothetical protein
MPPAVKRRLATLAAVASLQLPLLAGPRQAATRPTIEVIGPATAPATSPHAPGPAPLLPQQVRIREFGVRFSIPGDFVSGRFEARGVGWFDDAAVFVERGLAQGIDPQRIPTGGAVPGIMIMRMDARLRAVFDPVLDESWKTRLGPHEVYKLPGAPGPSGEEAHCYLLKRGDGGLLVWAHRMHPRDAAGERAVTHYDWVAERIIATMEFQD